MERQDWIASPTNAGEAPEYAKCEDKSEYKVG